MKKLLEVSLGWNEWGDSTFNRLENYQVSEVSSAKAAPHEPDADESCRELFLTVTSRRRGIFAPALTHWKVLKDDVKRFWRRFIGATVGLSSHGGVGLRDRQIEENDS